MRFVWSCLRVLTHLKAPTQIARAPLSLGGGGTPQAWPLVCPWLCSRPSSPSGPRAACLGPRSGSLGPGMCNEGSGCKSAFFQHLLPWKGDLSWEEGLLGWRLWLEAMHVTKTPGFQGHSLCMFLENHAGALGQGRGKRGDRRQGRVFPPSMFKMCCGHLGHNSQLPVAHSS